MKLAYEEFKGAIDKAGATKAPASPYADIAGLFNSQFALGAGAGPTAGLIGTARVDDANAQAAAAAANRRRASELSEKNREIKQKLADYQNPNKWQQVPKADGGYDFYDPLGKKVTVGQYSEVVGKQPYEVLKDSDNSIDQQFVKEYNALKAYSEAQTPEEQLKAIVNNPSLLEVAQAASPGQLGQFKAGEQKLAGKSGKDKTKVQQQLAEQAKQYLDKLNPEDAWRKFIEYYSPFFSSDDAEDIGYPSVRPPIQPVEPPSLYEQFKNKLGI